MTRIIRRLAVITFVTRLQSELMIGAIMSRFVIIGVGRYLVRNSPLH